MIAYLDTSCLAKLYVEEDGSQKVADQVIAAESVVVSAIVYPEMKAAFARLKREGFLSDSDFRKNLRRFQFDWENFLRLDVNESVIHKAGDLVEHHPLRTLDAIHLASALFIRSESGNRDIMFLTADKKLLSAAKKEGFHTS